MTNNVSLFLGIGLIALLASKYSNATTQRIVPYFDPGTGNVWDNTPAPVTDEPYSEPYPAQQNSTQDYSNVNYTPNEIPSYDLEKRIQALLTVIRVFESGSQYDALAGYVGTVPNPAMHPAFDIVNFPPGGTYAARNGGFYNRRLNSSAAGAYQIIKGTWQNFAIKNGITSFDSDSQDQVAALILQSTGALNPLSNGNLESAIRKASVQWASLPGGTQSNHTMQQTLTAFNSALGAPVV